MSDTSTRHEDTIEALLRTAQSLMQAETAEDVADVAVSTIRGVLRLPITCIHLYDEDAERLSPVALTDRASEVIGDPPAFSPGDGLAWQVFDSGEAQVHEDVSSVPGRLNPDTAIGSEIILPLDDHGVLTIGSVETDAFDETDISLSRLVATHITTALDHVESEQTIADLHSATRDMIQAETTQEVADIGVKAAKDIVGLPITSIQLYNEAEDVLRPVAFTPEVRDLFGEVPEIEPGDSIIWRAFSSGSVEVHDDVRDDPDVLNTDTVIRSQIILPLDAYGVLVCNSTEIGDFDRTEVTLARILAENTKATMNRIEQEQTLRRRTHRLDRQNEQLERFAQIISHDLKNPLNVAMGQLAMTRENHDSDHLAKVDDALDRMADIIENTLTLAKQGTSVGDREPIEVTELATRCWNGMETEDATLEIVDSVEVEGDPDRLRHVFENLFRNAIVHGSKSVTVRVGELDDEGFYVSDDGPGIPEDRRTDVFFPGNSTGESGTGFGLAIVREIIRGHGWDLRLTEGEAGGARFEISTIRSSGA